MIYEVWSEGYAATGEYGPAMCHRRDVEADNFQEACDQVFSVGTGLVEVSNGGRRQFIPGDREFHECYDRDRLTFWGCRLFTNEQEARMSYG